MLNFNIKSKPSDVSTCLNPNDSTASSGAAHCVSIELDQIKEGQGDVVSCTINNTPCYFFLTAAHNMPASWRTSAPHKSHAMRITVNTNNFTLMPPNLDDVFYDDFCDVALVPIQYEPRLAACTASKLSIAAIDPIHSPENGQGSLIRATYINNDLAPGNSGKGLKNKKNEVFCIHSQRSKQPQFHEGHYERRGTHLCDIWERVNNGNQRTAMWHVLSGLSHPSEWVPENPDLQARRASDETSREAELNYFRSLLKTPAPDLESMIVEENRYKEPIDFKKIKGKTPKKLVANLTQALEKTLGNYGVHSEFDIMCQSNHREAILEILKEKAYQEFNDDIKPVLNPVSWKLELSGDARKYKPQLQEALLVASAGQGGFYRTTQRRMKDLWDSCKQNFEDGDMDRNLSYSQYENQLLQGRYTQHDAHPPEKGKAPTSLHEKHSHIHLYVHRKEDQLEKVTFVFD